MRIKVEQITSLPTTRSAKRRPTTQSSPFLCVSSTVIVWMVIPLILSPVKASLPHRSKISSTMVLLKKSLFPLHFPLTVLKKQTRKLSPDMQRSPLPQGSARNQSPNSQTHFSSWPLQRAKPFHRNSKPMLILTATENKYFLSKKQQA
jgi:hypothetical protein